MMSNSEVHDRLRLVIKNIVSNIVPPKELDYYTDLQFDLIVKAYPALLDTESYNAKYFTTYRIDAILDDIIFNYVSKYDIRYNGLRVMHITDTTLKPLKSEIKAIIKANRPITGKG